MPQLPIEILENVVDSSADYPQLLSSLSLTSRMLTARTRIHLFHTIHLGNPTGPHPYNRRIRFGKVIPTRCDTFLELCIQNCNLALYIRVLVLTESVWHPTIGMVWIDHSHSLVPVVRSLKNLKGFAFRTEGINVALSPPLDEALSLVLSRPDMEWINLSDLRFAHGSELFRVFMNAAPLRVLKLTDIAFHQNNQVIPDLSGYIPLRIDTLSVSFDIQRVTEEPFIRNTLRRACPLFHMHGIRCLQIQVYHAVEDMDRVYAWLSMTCSVEDLDVHIVPGNKALRWRNRRQWKFWHFQHFDSSKGLHMSRLKRIAFRMGDHAGVGKIAAAMQFIVFAECLTRITICFNSARGPVAFLDEEAWRQVDAALSRAPVFPLLESIEICFGKNSYIVRGVEEKLRGMMPNVVDILRITLER
ncbi:hypothetical protein B0H10DRAFT_2339223 [Mycena sp. CBHHK59/15]|nr:hypothetical protein B0H10DRAFT_2339223 [Mycena sp. CBHHK59/15]